jgi:hypothetical protein
VRILNINKKIKLFIDCIESMKLPDSRGTRLFCIAIDEDEQGFYYELDNIIEGLNRKGENIENINISELIMYNLQEDNMLAGIIEIEKSSPNLIDNQYRILEKYIISKIKDKVQSSRADIIVLSRVEFTYPYVINAFRIMMEFENETNKSILLILPAERKGENLYKYLDKKEISSPSYRIKDITDF